VMLVSMMLKLLRAIGYIHPCFRISATRHFESKQ
jgi:hypothetical protein